MMVLVAVGIGTGWLYSVGVTVFAGGGDVFYEASTMLAAFVLLGHWFEMKARGGANDAIRSLLDLAHTEKVNPTVDTPNTRASNRNRNHCRPRTGTLSPRNRDRVPEVSTTYRSHGVKHLPGQHTENVTVATLDLATSRQTTGCLEVRHHS
jgi:hypothetical protein